MSHIFCMISFNFDKGNWKNVRPKKTKLKKGVTQKNKIEKMCNPKKTKLKKCVTQIPANHTHQNSPQFSLIPMLVFANPFHGFPKQYYGMQCQSYCLETARPECCPMLPFASHRSSLPSCAGCPRCCATFPRCSANCRGVPNSRDRKKQSLFQSYFPEKSIYNLLVK